MRLARTPSRALLAAPLVLLLAACGSQDAVVDIVAIGPTDSPFETGGRLAPAAQLLRGSTAEGLVGLDEQGRVTSAMAERWIVDDGGLSYIFRLRAGNWPDGSPITADSGRTALRQALSALRGTALALDLGGIEDIRVMTGRVVELRLARPQPELLQLLAQPELGLLRKGLGGGPMKLNRAGSVATLTPIEPQKRGLPAVEDWSKRARKLQFRALPAAKAVERFNLGQANAVLGGKIEDFPLVDVSGLSRGAIQLDPVTGLFGLVFAHGDGFLSLPANREAVAMAIDREGLLGSFGIGGWTPTNRIVPPGIENSAAQAAERWSNMSLEARRALATTRVTRWNSRGQGRVSLRIALPGGLGADRLFNRLAGDLQRIGLDASRVGVGDPADLRLVDSVARYPRIDWFLNQLNCASQRGLCTSDADKDAAAARNEADPAIKAKLQARAVTKLTDANVFIPFGSPMRWSLVRGDTTGFAANQLGYHPLMALALLPK